MLNSTLTQPAEGWQIKMMYLWYLPFLVFRKISLSQKMNIISRSGFNILKIWLHQWKADGKVIYQDFWIFRASRAFLHVENRVLKKVIFFVIVTNAPPNNAFCSVTTDLGKLREPVCLYWHEDKNPLFLVVSKWTVAKKGRVTINSVENESFSG